MLITCLFLFLEVCNVTPTYRKSWAKNLLMQLDFTLGSWGIQIASVLRCARSSLFYLHFKILLSAAPQILLENPNNRCTYLFSCQIVCLPPLDYGVSNIFFSPKYCILNLHKYEKKVYIFLKVYNFLKVSF